jgi:hypothetical protein
MAGAEWLMKRCRKGKKKEGRKEQREGLRDRGRGSLEKWRTLFGRGETKHLGS